MIEVSYLLECRSDGLLKAIYTAGAAICQRLDALLGRDVDSGSPQPGEGAEDLFVRVSKLERISARHGGDIWRAQAKAENGAGLAIELADRLEAEDLSGRLAALEDRVTDLEENVRFAMLTSTESSRPAAMADEAEEPEVVP